MLASCTMPPPANDTPAMKRAQGLEQSRGWVAHAAGLPFDANESPRWQRGWALREETTPRKDAP